MSNGLFVLYEAACDIEEKEASASQNQIPTPQETHGKSNGSEIDRDLKETSQTKVNVRNVESKPDSFKIPTHLVAAYYENTSDEVRRRFSFKCRYPNCSEVVESYGSDEKSHSEIKFHIWNCHLKKEVLKPLERVIHPVVELDVTSKLSSKSSKRCRSVKTVKTVSEGGSKRSKSSYIELTEKEKNDFAEAIFLQGLYEIPPLLKFGQSEHDYAKNEDAPSASSPPVHEAAQGKNQQGKLQSTLDALNKHISGDACPMPSVIPAAAFPMVYDPEPNAIGVAQIVELYSNGDPVDYTGPTFVQSSTSKISAKKAVENKASRKKSNLPRSVLECVENRVACEHGASSEQRDAHVSDNSIENSENVDKSITEIASRNIKILNRQRRKRKYCVKPEIPPTYVCEICDQPFTANTSLIHHYMSHLKMKPYRCLLCCKTFTRRHSLKYHMMIHAKINRFQCATCQRQFRHPSHYREHLRKHTGEEPFSCKFCSNKFKTRNSYKRHLKFQHQKLLTSNGVVPIRSVS